MNGNNYLLDTNIVIGLFANDFSIVEKIKSTEVPISISIIVIGELLYGAEQSTKKHSNRERLEQFFQISNIFNCDLETSRQYAIIKSFLKSNGTPIPENDIWIAALARQHKSTLVTRDKHFNNINELLIENW